MNTYQRLSVAFERGEGAWLWDTNGNRYLDALSGIAVCVLGHAHPVVTQAIQTQAAKLMHTSNLYQIPNQTLLANKLASLTGLPKVFFGNSGAEAVEAALKLTRLYGHQQGIEFPRVVVMSHAFHGRTFATIAAGGSPKVQAGFEPMMPGFIRVPFNDVDALHHLADTNKNIVAILLEPIQGEGGIRLPAEDYLKQIRSICDKHKWLLVLDEIQTGMGRTGTLFAYQGAGIMPDMITVAKGLANGFPIGACLASDAVGSLFKPGNHGSTFGGNPLACAAGLATLTEIEANRWWENAKTQGKLLLDGLQNALSDHPHVVAVRGKGLMIGVELDRPCRDILPLALEKRILFNVTNETVIRLLPSLIITEEHVKTIIDTLPKLIDSFTTPGSFN
jgi:acetylornithine/N-succinyldiaminopimelate aminotransferase